jgi:hypothetical protein
VRLEENCNIAKAAQWMHKIVASGGRKFPASAGYNVSETAIAHSGRVRTHRLIIGPFGERFTRFVIKSIDSGTIVREVVNPARWKMDPSIGNAGKNDLVRHVEIHNEIKRGTLLPEQPSTSQRLRQ